MDDKSSINILLDINGEERRIRASVDSEETAAETFSLLREMLDNTLDGIQKRENWI